MGFRSTFVTEDHQIVWPDWFKQKYEGVLNFGRGEKGALSAKHEYKHHERGDGLLEDIQRAIDWDTFGSKLRPHFVLVYLHECGGITRVEISKDAIRFSQPDAYSEIDEIEHDECYGCSNLAKQTDPKLQEDPATRERVKEVYVPILLNHDPQKIVGVMRGEGKKLVVEFAPDINLTKDELFSIFGDIGFLTIDEEVRDEIRIIRKLKIYEFSLFKK